VALLSNQRFQGSAITAPILPVAGVLILFVAFGAQAVLAEGIYTDGIGARSMSMGGADVAHAIDPLGAMGANPAGLGFITTPSANLGFAGRVLQGLVIHTPGFDGTLSSSPAALPEGAFVLPLGRVTLGVSVVPVSYLDANWKVP
jgi:hypothetical protein